MIPYVLSVDCRTCGLESRRAVGYNNVNRITMNLEVTGSTMLDLFRGGSPCVSGFGNGC